MMNENRPLVCVRCFTYNQSAYIEETLNGFCAQQTDFQFVCCIVDDASTDGEQEVIKAYLHEHFELSDKTVVRNNETEDYVMSFARHKANRNCFFAVFYLKYNHYRRPDKSSSKYQYISEWHDNAKYIALCEGDDFWIDSSKLQKQVDYMESHHDCSLMISNGIGYYEETHKRVTLNPIKTKISRYLSIHEIFIEQYGLIPTASMLYKQEMKETEPDWCFNAPVGDRPLRMWCAIHGKVYYDINPLVTYRIGSIGSFNQRAHNYDYSLSIYNRMRDFYLAFDEFTRHEYSEDIQYMIDREEFDFYCRIGDDKSKFKTNFFNNFPFVKKVAMKWIYLIKKRFPQLYVFFKKIIILKQ